MKRRLLKYGSIVAAIAFLAVFYGLAIHNTPGTEAVKATDFNPGRIIDDAIFYNPDTMTVEEIQAFLDAKLPTCDMWGTGSSAGRIVSETGYVMPAGSTNADYARLRAAAGNSRYHEPPYVCVNKYYENPETHETLYETKGIVKDGMISAAQIIYNEAHKYNINPQVLLVLLKKESYVWGDTWPLKWEYNSAMGYGCPDTAPCDTAYYGFYNQVHMAAYQFDRYKQKNYEYNYHPGMINNIYYSPDYSCGTKQVYIENMATASLYIYTPYTPNDAALANYPGTSYCGSYGNRNFFMYFSEWFGSTTNSETVAVINKIHEYIEQKTDQYSYIGKPDGDAECAINNNIVTCWQKYNNGYVFSSNNSDSVYVVSGGIYYYYLNNPRRFGAALSNEKYDNGIAYQIFENGAIIWTQETNSFEVSGAIYREWAKEKHDSGRLGYPISPEAISDKGFTYQRFQNGTIYWTSTDGVWTLEKYAANKWEETGGKQYLGLPSAYHSCNLVNSGCYQAFENGMILWTEETGAHELSGGIMYRWKNEGSEGGFLGFPTSSEMKDSQNNTYQLFQKGTIYWNSEKGTWIVDNFADELWRSTGGISYLGLPNGYSSRNLINNGSYQAFENGMILWTEETGAHELSGGIMYRWKNEGSEGGFLGFPTSSEMKDSQNNTYQLFQKGTIYWNSEKGTWIE